MGNFFHSVHIRTSDEAAAQAALNQACSEKKIRLWAAPLRDGWLSFFPNNDLWVSEVCTAISLQLSCPVSRTLVHDSDIFGYVIYRNGVEEDEFASNPDYFKEASEAERKRAAGDPEKLRPFLRGAHDWERLTELRRQRLSMDPELQMQEFMELLGITNGLSSYDYLERGEHDAVTGWGNFIHIPDVTAEKEARIQERKRIKTRKQVLAKEGVLVFDRDLVRSYKPFDDLDPIAGDASSGGFLLTYRIQRKDVFRWMPPSLPEPVPGLVGFDVISQNLGLHLVKEDPESRRFFRSATQHPSQPFVLACSQRKLGVIDPASGKVIKELEVRNPQIRAKKTVQWNKHGANPSEIFDLEREDLLCCAFSPDGELVFGGTSEGLRVYRFSDVLAATSVMPPPIAGVETSKNIQDYRWVHSLIVHAESHSIVHTVGDEGLYRYDWHTGRDTELTPAIGRFMIHRLQLSGNGQLLACMMRGPFDDPRLSDTRAIRVWNLPMLLDRTDQLYS